MQYLLCCIFNTYPKLIIHIVDVPLFDYSLKNYNFNWKFIYFLKSLCRLYPVGLVQIDDILYGLQEC